MPDLRITEHARWQLARRGIPIELLEVALRDPHQRVAGAHGRTIYHLRYTSFSAGHEMLLRVITEPSDDTLIVVSVYATSRVDRYWLREA